MVGMFLGVIIRHGLTMLGGALAANGVLVEADIQTVVGALATLAGVGLSALNKVKTVAKINAAADSFKSLNK